jgi:mannose-6-phosphate isomerase-like protein (cupin superfamily)
MKGFKVKLLFFRKGRACSLQKHSFRSELWLFLLGSGVMENNSSIEGLSRGSYEVVPVGNWHRFTAQKNTIVLEVQYGEECTESDIERI